ncbi:MAG: pimeloyl-CoA dehydrogenase large subunit, partial [Rhodospirillales bacterium]|nr:pimeloyl-CoA dehydrogenase large subunit [Rhodospirillales bacterium]
MDLKFSDDVEAFRDEGRAFGRDNLPADRQRKVAAERMALPRADHQRWHK